MQLTADLEALTRDYGRELFARLDRRGPLLFGPDWWDERLMEWTMATPAVKVQLFRFIDVLPLLHTPVAVNRHLREYFTQAQAHLSPWLRHAVRHIPNDGVAGRFLSALARRNAERL